MDPSTQALITQARTREKLDSPSAGLTLTVQFPPAKGGLQGLGALRTAFIGVDVINTFANNGQSPQMPNDNNTRGSANTQLFAAALKDACSTPFDPPGNAGDPVGSPSDNLLYTSPPAVTVTVGDAPPSTSTHYSYDATTSGTYTEMSVESKISTRRGTMGSPIASGGSNDNNGDGNGNGNGNGNNNRPDAEILTLSRPFTRVTYKFEAERLTIPPVIPDPNVNDGNLALISDELTPMAVGLAPDGVTPVYRIGGVYEYVARNARVANAAVHFGVHPWTDFSYDDSLAQMSSSNFQHGLIDSFSGNPNYPSGGGDPTGPDGPIGPAT